MGCKICSTEIVGLNDGKERTILILTRAKRLTTGKVTIHRTRNLIVAREGAPNTTKDPLVVHSSEYATSSHILFQAIFGITSRRVRIGLVGSRQSAVEVTLNSNEEFQSSVIDIV
ncbi:hypothetical protein E1B28_012161 [Marasmius oreades]|uniref:L-ornithine N(5)-monooxygenase [NAD(P)H] n=1 Tax=Marasmius oreades TaxID=181124 RepID=A0A9P7RR03_9AGAR|nr:uncharacterized protein E1B28_012161 [Marasmius oreades]KAG7088139.1 hypothetical protein E1B28_012161 [Marasmius oreades]